MIYKKRVTLNLFFIEEVDFDINQLFDAKDSFVGQCDEYQVKTSVGQYSVCESCGEEDCLGGSCGDEVH